MIDPFRTAVATVSISFAGGLRRQRHSAMVQLCPGGTYSFFFLATTYVATIERLVITRFASRHGRLARHCSRPHQCARRSKQSKLHAFLTHRWLFLQHAAYLLSSERLLSECTYLHLREFNLTATCVWKGPIKVGCTPAKEPGALT